jgi:hypothetical protein
MCIPASRVIAVATSLIAIVACTSDQPTALESVPAAAVDRGPVNPALLASGKEIFRFDTFGDETFWTDTLRMHEVIASSVGPATALSVGLKVDVSVLPDAVSRRSRMASGSTTRRRRSRS